MLATRFPALRFKSFRIFWFGQFISLIGTWMQSTVLPYLAYRLTDQPFYLGLIGFAGTIPSLFLTLPAGVLIERFNKRKIVILMQTIMMLQASTLAFLTLTDRINAIHIVALSFLSGLAMAFEITARQSMLLELVDKDTLPNAIALQTTIFNAARVLGPSLSAPFLLFLGKHGEGWAFFANGVSFIFVIIGLLKIKTHRYAEPVTKQHGFWEDFKTGQMYIRKTAPLGLVIVLAAVPGFFGFQFIQQIPVFARDVLAQANDTEAFVAARNSLLLLFQGIGALIAALFLAFFSTFRRKGRLLVIGQAVFSLSLIGLSQTHQLNVALILLIFAGWGMVTQLTLNNTIVQLIATEEFRGRVISTYIWAFNGIAPFGSLFLGWMAQSWGVQRAVLFGGGLCLVVFIIMHLLNPRIYRFTTEIKS
jgi:MFS family permease